MGTDWSHSLCVAEAGLELPPYPPSSSVLGSQVYFRTLAVTAVCSVIENVSIAFCL